MVSIYSLSLCLDLCVAFCFKKFEVPIGDDVSKSYKRSYPKLTQFVLQF